MESEAQKKRDVSQVSQPKAICIVGMGDVLSSQGGFRYSAGGNACSLIGGISPGSCLEAPGPTCPFIPGDPDPLPSFKGTVTQVTLGQAFSNSILLVYQIGQVCVGGLLCAFRFLAASLASF